MKRDELMPICLAVATLLTGCAPATIKLVYISDESKVVLNPDKGMVLLWSDPQGPVPITFPFGNPCKTTDPVGQCTISVDKARVPYLCKNCTDPEIVVGSSTGVDTTAGGGSVPPKTPGVAPTATVYMGCNSNQVAIYPAEAKIPKAALAAGATVLWVPGGLTPVGADWSVDGFSAAICTNSPPFNKDNTTCGLKPDLTAGSTTYKVSAATCNNTNTAGTITITP